MALLRGIVTKGGSPLRDARVSVHAAGFIGGSIGETHTNSGGEFALPVADNYTRVRIYINGQDKGEVRASDYQSFSI